MCKKLLVCEESKGLEFYKSWYESGNGLGVLSDDDMLYIIDLVGFEVYCAKDIFSVKDQQGANLGNIEGELFDSLSAICKRISHYFDDYFLE